ncbi:MAG: hypothetical protein H0X68_07955 [Chloroflexi bacterium]|nr:hypothetical protein [Chloroflexota bacterium]
MTYPRALTTTVSRTSASYGVMTREPRVTMDEALAWGRKAAVACRVPVEVRPFH